MNALSEFTSQIPSGLASEITQLTAYVPITTTAIPTAVSQNYETITSVLNYAYSQQSSALSALKEATQSVSQIGLINDIVEAQATINFYSILEVAATETNSATKASLMTQAAEASQIMLNVFDENAFFNGNYPSFGGNLAVLILYAVFLVIQVISGVFFHQYWFLTCWSIALVLEIIGYAGRIWCHENLLNLNPFVMQLVCITLAPCFMMAGIYYVIAQLTLVFGQKFSILRPMQYSLIFIICDIISIVLQAVGGGAASTALQNYKSSENGTHIMVGGLAFQVFTIAVFQIFWYNFLFRIYKAHKRSGDAEFNRNFVHIRQREGLLKAFICAVSFAVVFIFIRSIYRLIELSEGWTSKPAVDEIYFMLLEAMMILLATCLLSIFSPGLAYGRGSHIYIDKSLAATFKKGYNPHSEGEAAGSFIDDHAYEDEPSHGNLNEKGGDIY